MNELLTTISSCLLTIMGGTASVIWFYSAKKRTANAEATKAEADAISMYAQEWRELYEQRDKDVENLNAKIDALYNDMNELRKQLWDMREKYSAALTEKRSAEFFKCLRHGCEDRIPPNEKL